MFDRDKRIEDNETLKRAFHLAESEFLSQLAGYQASIDPRAAGRGLPNFSTA